MNIPSYDDVRLPVNAGNLYVQASFKERPGEQAGGFLAGVQLPVNPVERTLVNSHIIDPNLRLPRQHALVLAKNYSSFIMSPTGVADSGQISAAMLGLLCDQTSYYQLTLSGQMHTAFEEAGYELNLIIYDSNAQIRELGRDPEVMRVLDLFREEQREKFLLDRREQMLMIGPIMLTLTKTINPQGYQNWLKNRVRTFRGVLGISEVECIWTETQFPSQVAMQTSNTIMSAMFQMRRTLFLVCVGLASGTKYENRFFQEIVNFSQGAEMSHIMLIDQHIFGHFPEFLRLRMLRSNLASVRAAWEFLNRLPPSQRYFARILYTKEQASLLTRVHFGPLIQVATAIGQYSSQSMQYYKGGQTDQMSNKLASAVTRYLERRVANISYAVLDSKLSYFGPHESQVYERQIAAGGIAGQSADIEAPDDRSDEGVVTPAPPVAR